MSDAKANQKLQRETRAGTWLSRAWWSVALIPAGLLAFVILMLFLYELSGYKPENADAPLWVALAIGLVCVALFWVPCASAVVCGSRAGRRGGWPMAIGATAGIAVTIVTIIDAISNAPL